MTRFEEANRLVAEAQGKLQEAQRVLVACVYDDELGVHADVRREPFARACQRRFKLIGAVLDVSEVIPGPFDDDVCEVLDI